MKISVTQDHINNGVRGSQCACPIALAILEQSGWFLPHVVVGSIIARINGVRYYLPQEAQTFVEKFDNDLPTNPFEFEMVIL